MRRNSFLDYVKKKAINSKDFIIHKRKIFFKDNLSEDIFLNRVINFIESNVPEELFQYIDYFIIGDFNSFKEREINALYHEGVIYISNIQEDEQDLIDDIIHELAHSIEKNQKGLIYGGVSLESEFHSRRMKLYQKLLDEGFNEVRKMKDKFSNPEYDSDFDFFIYENIGYENIRKYASSIFVTPYAVTSLEEYFATGFEYYFLKSRKKLREVSPYLFSVIERIYEELVGKRREYI